MKNDFVPSGWPRVIPRIVAHDASELVDFIRRVFDAQGDERDNAPTELRIGDSLIMISQAAERAPMPAFLYVYVGDADATFQRAVDAGALVIEQPFDLPYGDRRGMVADRWGNIWQIATHLGASR